AAGIVEPIVNGQPRVSHQFVHALVRDAAYASQEQGQRFATHRRLASALEERAGADPGLVAYHYDAAHDVVSAITWYLRAGSAAQMAAANAEAIQHFDRGLELVDSLPAVPERDIAELHLHIARGTSHVNTLGYGAPNAADDFRRSLELSEQIESGDVAPPTAAVWAYYVVHGDLRAAAEAARRLEELGGPDLEPEILCCIGVQRFFEGRCRDARAVLDSSVAGFERRRPEERASRRWLLPSDAFCVALT